MRFQKSDQLFEGVLDLGVNGLAPPIREWICGPITFEADSLKQRALRGFTGVAGAPPCLRLQPQSAAHKIRI